MAQKWHQKATVQAAIVAGVFVLLAAVFGPFVANRVWPPSSASSNVVSVNQTGGITAHTVINRAAEPQIKDLGGTQTVNTDGTFTTSVLVEVVSPYPPASLWIAARAPEILSFDVVPQRIGGARFGHSGKRADHSFTTIESPSGQYKLIVRTARKVKVEFDAEFR